MPGHASHEYARAAYTSALRVLDRSSKAVPIACAEDLWRPRTVEVAFEQGPIDHFVRSARAFSNSWDGCIAGCAAHSVQVELEAAQEPQARVEIVSFGVVADVSMCVAYEKFPPTTRSIWAICDRPRGEAVEPRPTSSFITE